MVMTPDRYVLTWADGLCRHGCGQPLARPRNRFVNGHDSKLLDLLLDAHQAGDRIVVREPGRDAVVQEYSPEGWAERAFFEPGFRWFQIKAGITEPAYDELAGAEEPDLRQLSLGTPSDPPAGARSIDVELTRDLEVVREIVSRASASWTDVERLARVERALSESRAQVARLTEELAEASRPVQVDASAVAELSDKEALVVARRRAQLAAGVLDRARYRGISGEMWDVASLFISVDPVLVRSARAFLGQEDVL